MPDPVSSGTVPRWVSGVLAVAGVYNLAWAAWSVVFPEWSFARSGLADPDRPFLYPQVWQGVAGIVGVFGLGYLLAATDPARHWGVVLVGLVSKLVAAGGVAFGVASGMNRADALLPSVFNDFVWIVPLALVLRVSYRASRAVP